MASVNMGDAEYIGLNSGAGGRLIFEDDNPDVLHFETCSVGIGTGATVDEALHVDGNIKVEDMHWIGLGSTGGRLIFDDDDPDMITLEDCEVTINASGDGFTNLNVETYSDNFAHLPYIRLRRSHHDTVGTLAATLGPEESPDWLGAILFQGVAYSSYAEGLAFVCGAVINAWQHGTPDEGSDHVPAKLELCTLPESGVENAWQILLDPNGNVGLGIMDPLTTLHAINSHDESTDTEIRLTALHATNVYQPKLTFQASRGSWTDELEHSPVYGASAEDDVLGQIGFQGYDGSGFETGAKIEARIDGTPSDGTDMPGRLLFYTTPNGSATPLTRVTIKEDGKVRHRHCFARYDIACVPRRCLRGGNST